MDPPAGAGPRLLALLAALALSAAPGCNLRGGRLAILEDNDVFNLGKGLDVDRDYSQGAAAALTIPDSDTPDWARDFAGVVPLFADDSRVHLALALGQEIYTPGNLLAPGPIADDRPYAGWLWAGLAIQGRSLDEDPVRRRDRMDLLELDLGVVGPASQAERIQTFWHREILDIEEAHGWEHQLENEPGGLLTWERRYRVLAGDAGGGWGWDGIPRLRARLGNVRVDATAGAEARFGWNLPRDFGAMLVDGTGLSEGSAAPGPWVYATGGGAVRGVAYDIFLDGNTRKDGPSVDRRPFVPESTAGIVFGWGPFSGSFSQIWSASEFRERDRNHRTSRFLFSWTWYF